MKEIYSKSLATYHMCNSMNNSHTFCITLGVCSALSPSMPMPGLVVDMKEMFNECALKRYALTYCKLTFVSVNIVGPRKVSICSFAPYDFCMFSLLSDFLPIHSLILSR